MDLCIISFTGNGRKLSEHIAEKWDEGKKENEKDQLSGYGIKLKLFSGQKDTTAGESGHQVLPIENSVGEWAKRQMQEKNAMLFIGACGIAVRAVAPYLTDKLHDSPVLVMDEMGKYIIPVLSGHMGGANELARYIGKKTGAEPVITTATDINGKFAVDLFAGENNLYIVNKEGIVKVSSRVLAGEKVSISIEPEYEKSLCWKKMPLQEDTLTEEIYMVPYPPAQYVDIVVTTEEEMMFEAAVLLRPKEYVIGFGCKRGKTAEEISAFLERKLKEAGISTAQILALASVSQKSDEQGIVTWCNREKIPFFTYTAAELQTVEGNFTKSSFVQEKVGVDNVCERAALKACGENGKLVCGKCAEAGMTFALAKSVPVKRI